MYPLSVCLRVCMCVFFLTLFFHILCIFFLLFKTPKKKCPKKKKQNKGPNMDIDSDEDELINPELREEERLERNKARKEKKPIYNPYSDHLNSLLPQYDDEIVERDGFALDIRGNADIPKEERQKIIENELQGSLNKKVYSLGLF